MGFRYINDGSITKRVDESLVEDYLLGGWTLGRCTPVWNKGLNISDERIQKYANAQRGKIVSEETKRKISAKNKGRKLSQETIEKRTKTIKEKGIHRTSEAKKRVSEKLMGHPVSQETREKLSKANKGRPGVPCPEERRKYLSELHSSKEYQERENAVKKANGTFNTSNPEEQLYQMLVSLYGKEAIERQYIDDRYPFKCDFYLKEYDVFIELNAHWTHGDHPYNKDCEADKRIAEAYFSKSQDSKFYKVAFEVWTKNDNEKIRSAIDSGINYLVFYKLPSEECLLHGISTLLNWSVKDEQK